MKEEQENYMRRESKLRIEIAMNCSEILMTREKEKKHVKKGSRHKLNGYRTDKDDAK